MNILKNSFIRNLAVSTVLFSGCIENKVAEIDPCHVDDCRLTEVDAGIREILETTTTLIDYSFNDYQAVEEDALPAQDVSVFDAELPDMELDFSVEPDSELPDMEMDFAVEIDSELPDMEMDFAVEIDAELPDMEVVELCEPEIQTYEFGFMPIHDNNGGNAFSFSAGSRETVLDITVPENCEHFELEDIVFSCEGFDRRFDRAYLYKVSGELIDSSFLPEFENLNHEIESGTTESLQLRIDPLEYGPNLMVDPSSCDLSLDQVVVRENFGEKQTLNINSFVASIQNQPSLITTSLARFVGDLFGGENILFLGDFRISRSSSNTDENGAELEANIQSMEFEIRVEDTQIQEFRLEINQDIVIGNVSMDNRTVNFDLRALNIFVTADNFASFTLSAVPLNVNQNSLLITNLSNIRFTSSAHNEDIVYESREQDREFFRRIESVLTGQN